MHLNCSCPAVSHLQDGPPQVIYKLADGVRHRVDRPINHGVVVLAPVRLTIYTQLDTRGEEGDFYVCMVGCQIDIKTYMCRVKSCLRMRYF